MRRQKKQKPEASSRLAHRDEILIDPGQLKSAVDHVRSAD